jgi:hypothetical protein
VESAGPWRERDNRCEQETQEGKEDEGKRADEDWLLHVEGEVQHPCLLSYEKSMMRKVHERPQAHGGCHSEMQGWD